LQERRDWDNRFKVLNKPCQPRILFLKRLFFRNKKEVKTFPDKKLREFIITGPNKGTIQIEIKGAN
jgi:hypothetical protein